MFPRFGITAYPVETVDTSLTSWSSIFMLVGLTVALPLMVLAFDWLEEIEPHHRVARFFTKLAFGVLCFASFGAVVTLPFILMKRAETTGGVWTMWIIFALIGLLFRWLMKEHGLSSQASWIITVIFIVLCFLGAIAISLSILITSLAGKVILVLGFVALVFMAGSTLISKLK